MRKDLLHDRAEEANRHHVQHFSADAVQRLSDGAVVTNGSYLERDVSHLRKDQVGGAVADYGALKTTISSLAELKSQQTFRSELAMLSLARGYVSNCVNNGGSWTSALHLLWWTRRAITQRPSPTLQAGDLRHQSAVSQARQVDLATWSLQMLRLTFISDVGSYASRVGDPVGELRDLAERAAIATQLPSSRRLGAWMKSKAVAELERVLPQERYAELATRLRGW